MPNTLNRSQPDMWTVKVVAATVISFAKVDGEVLRVPSLHGMDLCESGHNAGRMQFEVDDDDDATAALVADAEIDIAAGRTTSGSDLRRR